MNMKRTLVCISLVLLSAVGFAMTPAAQKKEASKEIRSKLFKQLLAEDRTSVDCWHKYLDQFAERRRSPIEVTLK